MKRIKKLLIESLYGSKVGFMRFCWESADETQIDRIVEEIKNQLEQISVDTSCLKNLKDEKKIIIVTTEDKAYDIQTVFEYFGMPLENSIFDPTEGEEIPDNYLQPNQTIIRN